MTVLGLFVLYELFPRLTPGVRGCVYYLQCLATVTISLIGTLSGPRCLKAFQRNKCRPQIVAAQNEKLVAVASDQRNTVVFHFTHACACACGVYCITESAALGIEQYPGDEGKYSS